MINLNKNNIKDRTLVVETIYSSDRNIVLHFTNNQLVGINFWHGYNELDLLPDFIKPNKSLLNYLLRSFKKTDWWDDYEEFQCLYNSPNYSDILEWIDTQLWEFLEVEDQIARLQMEINELNKLFQ